MQERTTGPTQVVQIHFTYGFCKNWIVQTHILTVCIRELGDLSLHYLCKFILIAGRDVNLNSINANIFLRHIWCLTLLLQFLILAAQDMCLSNGVLGVGSTLNIWTHVILASKVRRRLWANYYKWKKWRRGDRWNARHGPYQTRTNRICFLDCMHPKELRDELHLNV